MAFTPLPSEEGRKLAHIASGSAALLLRYLTWWQAATPTEVGTARAGRTWLVTTFHRGGLLDLNDFLPVGLPVGLDRIPRTGT